MRSPAGSSPCRRSFPRRSAASSHPSSLILRALTEEFRSDQDDRLAFIGAFGYDLLFQFDPIELKLPRGERKDLHLFLADDILFMDRKKEVIERFQYDFAHDGLSTAVWIGKRSCCRDPRPSRASPRSPPTTRPPNTSPTSKRCAAA